MTDIPRLLTSEEIKTILSRVTPPQIMIPETRDHIYNEVKTMLAYQLAYIKIKPSKIEKLSDYIANKSSRSFFQPGTPIGFNVSESVGQPATQLVLNTFHSAGQASQSGFDRFKRNISPKDPKKYAHTFQMSIHMMNKNYSFEDLYIKAQQFVTISLEDLLEKGRIIKEEYPFEDMSMYTEDFKEINSYQDLGCGIRIRFDQEKLFLHKIAIENIALELEKVNENNMYTVFCGPQIEGVIDIYPNPDTLCTSDMKDIQECCAIFENGFLKNKLKAIKMGEYPHISYANISKIPVDNLIQDITPHYENPDDISNELVRVWVNWVYAKKEGVPVEKLQTLLELTGHPIVDTDVDGNYFIVKSKTLDIKDEIRKILKEENKKLMDSFEKTKRLSSTDLYIAGYYNLIKTVGSDLEEVRNNPEVDEFSTISDSVIEIYKVLGIEVARAYLEKEIFDLFKENDQNIAPRNITILVDWMTSLGRPVAVNTKSIPKSENSIMRAMCFEAPKDNIVRGAVLSTDEPLSNASARVLFGIKQSLGTGAFEIKENPELIKLYESFRTGDGSSSGYRLTSRTLGMPKISQTTTKATPLPDRPEIPDADSDLFGSELSKGSELEFNL